MNAKFQRIARRDKKAFLSEQCKEIEENNRTGKARDLFKKTGDIKGTFHARMGMAVEQRKRSSQGGSTPPKVWAARHTDKKERLHRHI